jgi:hypothetical protein
MHVVLIPHIVVQFFKQQVHRFTIFPPDVSVRNDHHLGVHTTVPCPSPNLKQLLPDGLQPKCQISVRNDVGHLRVRQLLHPPGDVFTKPGRTLLADRCPIVLPQIHERDEFLKVGVVRKDDACFHTADSLHHPDFTT